MSLLDIPSRKLKDNYKMNLRERLHEIAQKEEEI